MNIESFVSWEWENEDVFNNIDGDDKYKELKGRWRKSPRLAARISLDLLRDAGGLGVWYDHHGKGVRLALVIFSSMNFFAQFVNSTHWWCVADWSLQSKECASRSPTKLTIPLWSLLIHGPNSRSKQANNGRKWGDSQNFGHRWIMEWPYIYGYDDPHGSLEDHVHSRKEILQAITDSNIVMEKRMWNKLSERL